ncbi:MAG: hypothetical protein QNK26_00965 [Moritella sp.]|uniref:hypothetical protein n=1 Tax=Moritella sp. TaxID=78556 RepID=UPI0029A979C0|nr:hypothetical protein [Moritella sp.]MDX2319151.1 hypothetical protein [Moritella sp.]
MKYYQRGVLFAATVLFSSVSFAADNVIVRYQQTHDTQLQSIAKKLQSDSSIQDAINLMNTEFIFPQPLTIVFGSDDVNYAYLLEDTGFSVERGDFCISEYDTIANNWLTVLAPYMVSATKGDTGVNIENAPTE